MQKEVTQYVRKSQCIESLTVNSHWQWPSQITSCSIDLHFISMLFSIFESRQFSTNDFFCAIRSVGLISCRLWTFRQWLCFPFLRVVQVHARQLCVNIWTNLSISVSLCTLQNTSHFRIPVELWLMKCFDIFFQFDIIIGTNRPRKSWRIQNFLAATCCFIILQRRATTYSTTIDSMKAMMTIWCPMISRSGKATFQWKTSTRWDSGETWIRWWSSIVAALETHADNIFAIDDNGFDLQASHLHASLLRPFHIGELHSGLILFSENSMQMYL